MRKIIYIRPDDGGLSVVHPVINTIGDDGVTEAQAEQRAWNALPQDAINPQWIEASAIPEDRTFRAAWEHGGDRIIINEEKAKAIKK